MIIIQTTQKIQAADGSFPSGYLVVEPCDQFEYLESADSHVKKVGNEPVQVTFTDGLLDATFKLAPTLNASQDKSNLFYTATFYFNGGGRKIEYWAIDGGGAATLELTDIIQVVPDPTASTQDFIASDEVSVVPIANGIPRAKADGTLDSGWLFGIPNFVPVKRIPAVANVEDLPAQGATDYAICYVTNAEQGYFWAGGKWRSGPIF